MLLLAFRVNLLADHVTASLILISPSVPEEPSELKIVTLWLARLVVSALPVISPPLDAIVKSTGSISHNPSAPWSLDTLILTELISRWYPEVSIFPPWPLIALAIKSPFTEVTEEGFLMSDQTTIVPPSPSPKELALIVVFLSIDVVSACIIEPCPCQSPPILICPPWFFPVAFKIEFSWMEIWFPSIEIIPPSKSVLASKTPELLVAPLFPEDSWILLALIFPEFETNLNIPLSFTNSVACKFEWLIDWSTKLWAISLFKKTWPWEEIIPPWLSNAVWISEGSTFTVSWLLGRIFK